MIFHRFMINRAGTQYSRWKSRPVGCIGETLGLKGKTVGLTIRAPLPVTEPFKLLPV